MPPLDSQISPEPLQTTNPAPQQPQPFASPIQPIQQQVTPPNQNSSRHISKLVVIIIVVVVLVIATLGIVGFLLLNKSSDKKSASTQNQSSSTKTDQTATNPGTIPMQGSGYSFNVPSDGVRSDSGAEGNILEQYSIT